MTLNPYSSEAAASRTDLGITHFSLTDGLFVTSGVPKLRIRAHLVSDILLLHHLGTIRNDVGRHPFHSGWPRHTVRELSILRQVIYLGVAAIREIRVLC